MYYPLKYFLLSVSSPNSTINIPLKLTLIINKNVFFLSLEIKNIQNFTTCLNYLLIITVFTTYIWTEFFFSWLAPTRRNISEHGVIEVLKWNIFIIFINGVLVKNCWNVALKIRGVWPENEGKNEASVLEFFSADRPHEIHGVFLLLERLTAA